MNFISTTTSKNYNPYRSFNRQNSTGNTNKVERNIEIVSEIKPEDRVNHPSYYQDPSGVECITVTRHRDFNIGNAMKYLWRAGLKKEEGISDINKQIEDLKKAIFFINDEIKMLQGVWK